MKNYYKLAVKGCCNLAMKDCFKLNTQCFRKIATSLWQGCSNLSASFRSKLASIICVMIVANFHGNLTMQWTFYYHRQACGNVALQAWQGCTVNCRKHSCCLDLNLNLLNQILSY